MTQPPTLSFLDLVPIREGDTIAGALATAADIARAAEAAGYHRYWVAEHHGMAGIGGAATSVVLGHIGAATRTIRIGSGGIMLPNHAPLQIAEQFGTLDALFPGRIDLGLGRAPGSDQKVAAALRRTLNANPDAFVHDVTELQRFFAGEGDNGVLAVPGAGAHPELWILGSSLYGAQVAALLGLPYAFAAHFAPQALDAALATYRKHFRPSAELAAPHAMVGVGVIVAETDEDAGFLASSQQQQFVALRRGDASRPFPRPVPGFYASQQPVLQQMLDETFSVAAIGSEATVRARLSALLQRTQADELIITTPVYDPAARLGSIARTAEIVASLAQAPVA